MSEYIVWRPDSLMPSKKVFNKPNAIKAAYALASSNQGTHVYVCKLVGEVYSKPEPPKVVYKELDG